MSTKKITRAIALACTVLFALLALDRYQPFAYTRLRYLYRDAVSRAGRVAKIDPSLVFLAIDSDSVGLDEQVDARQLYGITDDTSIEGRAFTLMSKRFPWPREVYGLILERLVKAGAKVVAFDLTFPTSTDGDEPFRNALDEFREHVLIGSNFVNPSWNGLALSGASHTRPPDSLIPQTTPIDDRVAFTNFWPDPDDVVRRAQYRVTFEQIQNVTPGPESERFVSLAARALLKSGNAQAIPPDLEDHMFRFAGGARRGFPPHPLFEIFVPDYWKHNYKDGEFFRDKIVIVGAEGNWQHDEHQTPFGSMPGPELHLNAINAALQGEWIHEMSPGTQIALTIFAGLIAVALCLAIRSPWLRLAALGAGNLGLLYLALHAFNRGAVFVPMVPTLAELDFTVLFGLIADFASERVEKVRLRRTLERYVSRDVVLQLIDQPGSYAQSLGGVMRPVTILFSDIRGFSRVVAGSEPHLVVAQLNEYMGAMVDCVFRHGGTLDKFIGDAVMAVWGNVTTNGKRGDAVAAVRAALEMRTELARLNRRWRANSMPELQIGIGVNCGDVIVGNVGSPQRMEFTAIGEPVNTCWRLQELTKEFRADLIIGEALMPLLVEEFEMRAVGEKCIPPSQTPMKLFTVQGTPSALPSAETMHPERAST